MPIGGDSDGERQVTDPTADRGEYCIGIAIITSHAQLPVEIPQLLHMHVATKQLGSLPPPPPSYAT